MKALLLLSLCWLSSWGLQNVYITPDGNCSTTNGTVLEPCYTLNQLENLSSYLLEPSVALLFLPGTHMLQGGHGLDKFEHVAMAPLTVEDKVVINCVLISQDIIFLSNHSINIASLHFTSCNLGFGSNVVVTINKSQFENSYNASLVFVGEFNCGTSHVNIANCRFLSNVAGISAVGDNTPQQIFSQYGIMNITNTLFQGNGDGDGAAVLYINNYAINVNNTQFIQNTIPTIMAYFSTLNIFNTTFCMNCADDDTSTIYFSRSRALNISNCSFVDNSGVINIISSGGAVCSITNSRFQGNVASKKGGAIYATFNGNFEEGQLSICDCQFVNNSAQWGGALWLSGQLVKIEINMSSFISNKAEQGGAVYSESYSISFADIFFISNSAKFNGGAVYLSQGRIHGMNVTYSSNTALNGGAMYTQDSYIEGSNITVANNVAHDKGGAMYVADEGCSNPYRKCRIRLIKTTFSNNTASHGQILYGGLLDRCYVCDESEHHCISGIDYFKKYSNYETSKSAITSDPVRVCLCNKNSEVDCATRNLTVDKQRGQTINLTGVVVDQDSKIKKAFIRANYKDFVADFGEGEVRQQTDDNCTDMSFHVFTHNNNSVVQLVLTPEGICEQSDFSSITVNINVMPCTKGFVWNYDRCVCDPRLSDYVTSCDVDALTIEVKKSRVWVHYDEQFLKIHCNCPLDYCDVSLTINLTSQDEQCANHSSGVICGSCQDNYSIALGGSKCLDCSSSIAYAWLIPVFAVAGVALVALLLVCNMTISHGTLNGLIFYANVVSISRLTSFQDCSVNSLLSVFIAWINLDFGVETCFYAGMDTYQKTWLQFAFPLYIWILVGAIILLSHYSTRAVKIFGYNNIAVLATLFLLSYTKLLKTIITALNVTQVLRGSASNTSDPLVPYSVWVYDGNIEYLKEKHVPLFAFALATLIIVFLPYTLLLTFGQCIRLIQSRNKCVLWCIRSTAFVSIMDAYHAPYTNRHRYWTGFMLLVRCAIFLGFTFSFNNFLTNMFVVGICLLVIFTLRANIGKVYKNFGLSLLELTFLLNLAVLSVSVSFLQSNGSSDDVLCMCTNASISISLAMFIAILVYHAYIKMSLKIEYFKTLKDVLHTKLHPKQLYNRVDVNTMQRTNAPTKSVVELQEKLLESVK